MYCPDKPLGATIEQNLAKSLPLWPGYTFNFNVGADRHHRSSQFKIDDKNVRYLREKDGKPVAAIGGRSLPPWAPCQTIPEVTIYPQGCGPKVPSWIAFDKQVLSFDAYWQEPIPESNLENYRIHQCKIMFFPEDDTIKVVEPETFNAGCPQGTIIRRHRIPMPPPCEEHYYTLEHLNVACEIEFYGKVFYICGCDKFTRNFLNRLGIPVPEDLEMPKDLATEKMLQNRPFQWARRPYIHHDTRGPFLEHGKHVLRFWAYWDDRCNLHGDLRQFVLLYFLSDGTIEVKEIVKRNSGYDNFPAFIKRSKIPKNTDDIVTLPGAKAEKVALNVFGSAHAGPGSRKPAYWSMDNLGIGANKIEYYKDSDLAIGAVINVFGRAFTLADCDEFTKQYYREKYKIQNFTPLVLDEPKKEVPCPEPPPYNGWGGEEDSLASWKHLDMRPIVKDFRKQMALEKDILRYHAKLYRPLQKVNQDRRFTINYYMADDTIQIFENEHANTGIPKGTFLARSKVPKVPYNQLQDIEAEYFTPGEFYVGAILELNGFTFQLLGSDEFSYKYMEERPLMFPHSDIEKCLNKVREVFGPLDAEAVVVRFSALDLAKQGVITLEDFRDLLLEFSKFCLSDHEIITLSRAYECPIPPPGTDWATVQSIVQTEMFKHEFGKPLLVRMEYTFRDLDPCRTGTVDRDSLKQVLAGSRLPIYKELLDHIVKNWPAAEGKDCCKVDYCALLKFLNWEDNPAPMALPASVQCVMRWVAPKPPSKVYCVNYRKFLEDVCPNFKCALPAICCCCNQGKPCPQHPCPPCGIVPPPYRQPCVMTSETCNPSAQIEQPVQIHLRPSENKPICVVPHKCHPDSTHCHEDVLNNHEPHVDFTVTVPAFSDTQQQPHVVHVKQQPEYQIDGLNADFTNDFQRPQGC